MQAISLHLGLNAVSAEHYGGTYPLSGCHNDARDMAAIARAAGYAPMLLLDGEASATALLVALNGAAQTLTAGDALLLTYAGHGAQVPDTSGDEADGKDETWVLYDRMLLDDELYAAFARFTNGVRVLLISDSCHSGTVARKMQYASLVREGPLAADYAATTQRFRTPDESNFGERVWRQHAASYDTVVRGTPRYARELVRAAVIQIGGCQDDQLAADGPANGLFTSKLKAIWAAGAFRGDYKGFARAIGSAMPLTQTPNYLAFGNGLAEFEKQRPFTNSASTTIFKPPVEGCFPMNMNMQTQGDGNWPEVRAELERRFHGWRPPAAVSNTSAAAGDDLSFVSSPLGSVLHFGNGSNGASHDSRAVSGPPITRAFWWGFHIECSSQGLRDFLSVADPINAIAKAIGPMTGPAAPFVLAAAAFIAASLQLLRNLDRGNGVYISMSWFAPGVFIPTTVPGRGLAQTALRAPGEPYEQAGVPWRRTYGGGLFGIRLEEDIYWNLPDGTVREKVIIHQNPPNFGNIYFNHWLSDDLAVGHFRLHVGVAAFQGGAVELRMMIRDAEGRRSTAAVTPGPRVLSAAEL